MKRRNNKEIKLARENGEKLYFTGLECRNGHIDFRLTSNGTCVSCKFINAEKSRRKLGQKERPKEKSPLQIAKENNEIWYFTGIPCRYGHISIRLVSDRSCYTCSRLKAKNHKQENRAHFTALEVKRHANKLKATPAWADLKTIEKFYIQAKNREEDFNLKYHVDHIIPLQGKNVCGLHVENNLQILLATENSKKSNKYGEEQWAR